MPYFIGVLMFWQLIVEIFGIGFSYGLGPGMSLKNLVLYMGLAIVVGRGMLTGGLRFEPRGLHVSFVLLVVYAILSWAAVSFVIPINKYPVKDNGLLIKSLLVDNYAMFLMCFFALRTLKETITALKLGAFVSALPQIITLLDVSGLTNLGMAQVAESGRVNGPLGDANMYAAYLAFFLPTYVAFAVIERRLWRMFWLSAVLFGITALIMTASRGGFVALGVGTVIALMVFRRWIPSGRIFVSATGVVSLIVIVLLSVSSDFRSLLVDRVFADTKQADMGAATSGRTDFWIDALKTMAAKPITFVTGYGWRAFWSMPFDYSPHNSYLNYWFNLGLMGLVCFVCPFVVAIRTAIRAVSSASADIRYLLIAFVFGIIAVCIAVVFVELYSPWFYIWAYTGLVMRAALLASVTPATIASVEENRATSPVTRYGWVAP